MRPQSLMTWLFSFAILTIQLYSCASNELQQHDPKKLVSLIDSMTLVNDKPQFISTWVLSGCRLPTPAEDAKGKGSPHENFLINVYVNDIGKKAMTEMKKPEYPVGTIIIKEKFPFEMTFDSTSLDPKTHNKEVELYTIMVKREKGFNRKCGDWEFGAISGDLKDFQVGKIQKCMKCHKRVDQMDFVFRDDYLAEEYRKNMKDLSL